MVVPLSPFPPVAAAPVSLLIPRGGDSPFWGPRGPCSRGFAFPSFAQGGFGPFFFSSWMLGVYDPRRRPPPLFKDFSPLGKGGCSPRGPSRFPLWVFHRTRCRPGFWGGFYFRWGEKLHPGGPQRRDDWAPRVFHPLPRKGPRLPARPNPRGGAVKPRKMVRAPPPTLGFLHPGGPRGHGVPATTAGPVAQGGPGPPGSPRSEDPQAGGTPRGLQDSGPGFWKTLGGHPLPPRVPLGPHPHPTLMRPGASRGVKGPWGAGGKTGGPNSPRGGRFKPPRGPGKNFPRPPGKRGGEPPPHLPPGKGGGPGRPGGRRRPGPGGSKGGRWDENHPREIFFSKGFSAPPGLGPPPSGVFFF